MRSWMPRVNCGVDTPFAEVKTTPRCKPLWPEAESELVAASTAASAAPYGRRDVLVGVRPLLDDVEGANPNANAGFG